MAVVPTDTRAMLASQACSTQTKAPMEPFQIGDVVMLKSGGPTLTVSEVGDDGQVICVWFVTAEPKKAVFTAGSLIKT